MIKRFLCSLLFLGIATTGVFASESLPTIAVFDLDIPGIVAIKRSEGEVVEYMLRTNILTDKFVTSIVKSNRLKVVERSRMDEILTEMDFSSSGVADPETCIEVGKLTSANLLLFGTLDNLESSISEKKIPYTSKIRRTGIISAGANIRLVDTETGEIRTAHTASITHTVSLEPGQQLQGAHMQEALDVLVSELTHLLLDEIFPMKVVLVNESQVYINQGANNGVSLDDTYDVFRTGVTLVDPDTGITLGTEEFFVGSLKVIRVDAKMSIAVPYNLVSPEVPMTIGDICRPQRALFSESQINSLFD